VNVENLSDYENMIDENTIEPDYFIDRPPTAIFQPDSPKHNRSTFLDDKKDLFDFNIEAEPILQVLIGKAIEQSRIELIEDFEVVQLALHKKQFKTLRESELN